MTDHTPSMSELREEIRTVAAREAIDALRAVCKDPKATSQAKATAATSIMRAAGFFSGEDDEPDDKPLSELTAAELAKRADRARARLEAMERQAASRGDDVFD